MKKLLKQPADTKSIEFWKAKLKELEDEKLPKAMMRVGQAGVGGDWHENAEYEDAVNQQQLLEVRIKELKKLIFGLRKK